LLRFEPQPGGIDAYLERPCPFAVSPDPARPARWTSDFGTNTKQDVAIVIVETDAGLTGYGEAKGTPVVLKVLVEDVLGPQLVGEDPTRVEFLWEKMYSASRLPLAPGSASPRR
jgi:L-alanine-DL-glutamate epimerase-like enolase superfamily enzyme